MVTSFPMPPPWTDGVLVNAAALQVNVTTPINDLAAQIGYGQCLGDQLDTTTTTTLAVATTNYAAGAHVTFTLTAQTRVRIVVAGQFDQVSGTNARYVVRCWYNAGTTVAIGSGTGTGFGYSVTTALSGFGGATSGMVETTVLLAAGTYTVYPGVYRSSGGGATDTCYSSYVAAYAVGSA